MGHVDRGAWPQTPSSPDRVSTRPNGAGRLTLDKPRDPLICSGSTPVDVLAIEPVVIRKPTPFGSAAA